MPNTRYESTRSMNKMFTAVAIAQLVERGVLFVRTTLYRSGCLTWLKGDAGERCASNTYVAQLPAL